MIRVSHEPQRSLSQRLGLVAANVIGWKVVVQEPIPPKCVIIGAHHTTGFDFVVTLILRMASGLPFHFVAKASLFRGPMGWVARWLGGIPVERRASQNFVSQMIEMFEQHETLLIAIMPEGTRGRTTYWRTGFYHIAMGAGVPIVLGFADYGNKAIGLGPILWPSGDIEADFEILRRFYDGVTARYPERQGDVSLRRDEA